MDALPDGVAVVERGLAASWIRQVTWSGGGSLHRVGGLLVALSGVADQTQQVAVVEGRVEDPQASLTAAEVLFARTGWQPAVDIAAGVHPGLEDALAARGYRVVVSRPGMVRSLDGVLSGRRVEPDVAGVALRLARLADRPAVVDVQRAAFGLTAGIAEGLMPPAAFEDPTMDVLVAVDAVDRVVGAATVHFDGAMAGLIGAAVAPERRREGIGALVTNAALRRGAERGASSMWLQATEAGTRVYERCGFATVGTWNVWLGSQHA